MSKYKADNIFQSFGFAIRGLMLALKSQRNFKIDVIAAIIAVIAAFIFRIPYVEVAILTLTIGFMLFSELINTVIEFVVDAYFGHKYSILAKMAKDISAGAVLISALTSVTVGVVIFLPRILPFIKKIL